MRRVGSPKLGLRHSNQKKNPDAGFYDWPRYQDWKASSRIVARPQITKRRSVGPLSGAGGIARRRPPYHGPAAHIGCGASDRPHAVPGRGDPGRRWLQVQGRIRATLSGQGGIRPYELPPNRPQIKASRALLWIMRYESYACYELPRSVEALNPILKKLATSLQPLQTTRCPCRTPASYLKERRAKETPPSHACLSRTRD